MRDGITSDFLQAVAKTEERLLALQFNRSNLTENGSAFYIQYKNNDLEVVLELIFGPPEFQVEMLLYTPTKYAFKDLMNIREISRWVNDNRYIHQKTRNIEKEINWYIDLACFSLPILTRQ